MWEEAETLVIGPGHEILARTGDKLQARLLAEECQVPVLPALKDPTNDVAELQKFAVSTGYPIIIKAVDGGGGRGIRIVRGEKDLASLAKRVLQESPSGKAFAEKAAIDGYRHVEVQIIGDGQGNVRHLWERECSIQRRFGGRGIRIVRGEKDLASLAKRVLQESPSGKAFAEKAAIDGYRHVEVQIIGDGQGNVRHLWERECSIQRRFQKVVEFAPSSISDRKLITNIINSALKMAKKVNYSSLGTFEFLVRQSPPEFYFLEVNPRIQVEHTITESIAMNIDLVKVQLLLAQGQSLSSLPLAIWGDNPEFPPPMQSLQLRVTAEDVSNDWSLSVGKIKSFQFPAGNGVRVDTHLIPSEQAVIGTDFDSLIAKIIITAPSWEDIVRKAKRALADTHIEGIKTSLDVLRGIVASEAFAAQQCDTQWLEASLPSVLKSGKDISATLNKNSIQASPSGSSTSVAAASNVLFRKGDAWSISLTPESSSEQNKTPAPSHLQLARVLRNEFPASLTASILYTTPSNPKPVPYTLTLASTTASFGSLASSASHRRGDPGNSNHIIIPFPGQLMEIMVDIGDEIQKGETIAVVRQMKMELEIRATRGGIVAWVYEGEEGDEVGEGILVAEVEGGVAKL